MDVLKSIYARVGGEYGTEYYNIEMKENIVKERCWE